MSKITCHFSNFFKTQLKPGFTLVELLVVSSIFVLLMAATSGLFINFMVSGAKTSVNQKLKQEASDALAQMEFVIRNAKQVTSACDNNPYSEISIESTLVSDNMITTLKVIEDDGHSKIASSSGTTVPLNHFLSSSYSNPTDLKFICYSIPEKKSQYVSFSFTLEKAETNLSSEASQTVYGGVLVRNSRVR